MKRRMGTLLALTVAAACWAAGPAEARMTLKSICRIKGQEENTLQGLGIVVGLKGTGDAGTYLPTIRSLAKVMSVMDMPTSKAGLTELKDTKNVALVIVTATVPGAGARQGDKLDCVVSSVGSAKSLAGGRLFLTPLIGPDPRNHRVFAFAEGPITLEDPAQPTTGRVHDGCRLEEEFFNLFTKDGKITLVLEKNHADFQVAEDVVEVINSQMRMQTSSSAPMARAINQGNIEVVIPRQYADDPVSFVSQVLALPLMEPRTGRGWWSTSGPAASSSAATWKSAPWRSLTRTSSSRPPAARPRGPDPSSPSIPSIPAPPSSRPSSRPSTPSTSPPATSSKSSRGSIATANSTDNC